MGSYLTIVNNTADVWQCKIGPDEAALKIAGIIITVVGAVASVVIPGVGALSGLTAFAASNGVVSVIGVPTAALASTTAAAASATFSANVIGIASGFAIAIAQGVGDNLKNQGFTTIKPREKNRWGKMSLSLWQQGTCVKTTILNETSVRTETLYMRPIFSGAKDNSNIDHQIQWWINKWGTEKQDIVAKKGK